MNRLQAALALAHEGFLIGQCFGVAEDGCRCRNPSCKAPGKHGGRGWKDQATTDAEVIRTRMSRGDPNFLVIPAVGSRLVVIDEDRPGALEMLGPVPGTLTVLTSAREGGARGRHLYGRLPAWIAEEDIPSTWAGGEIRVAGNGGVVGPLCRHASGSVYQPVGDLLVAELPDAWVRALIRSGKRQQQGRPDAGAPGTSRAWVEPGGRHPHLTSRAGQLRNTGLVGEGLRDALRFLNSLECSVPLDLDEVDAIASWAAGQAASPPSDPMEADGITWPTPRDVGSSCQPAAMDEWIVEGVLRPRTILVIASPEGTGKSYVRKEMAARLTTGHGSLFGHYPIARPVSVLELDEENGEAEEFRREEQVFAALGVPRSEAREYRSLSFAQLQLSDEGDRGRLRTQLAAFRPEVLILDTGTSMVDDEWGPELKSAMRYLRSLTMLFGCAVVLCVHLTKPVGGRARPSRPHGTLLSDVMGQWTRLADAVALMADLGDGRVRWAMHKRVPRSELVLAQSHGLWTAVHVGAKLPDPTDVRVLRAIAAGGANPKEIALLLGVSSRTVSTAIGRLRTAGLLAPGHPYELTGRGRGVVA